MVRSTIALSVTLLCLGLGLAMAGCKGSVSESSHRNAQVAFDEASTLVQSADYAGALPLLEKAIGAGGLPADVYADALLLRSRCYAQTGDLQKAEEDLNHAEQGSPNPAQFQIAKGTLLLKQGKKAEADAAFKNAKKLDKNAVIPK